MPLLLRCVAERCNGRCPSLLWLCHALWPWSPLPACQFVEDNRTGRNDQTSSTRIEKDFLQNNEVRLQQPVRPASRLDKPHGPQPSFHQRDEGGAHGGNRICRAWQYGRPHGGQPDQGRSQASRFRPVTPRDRETRRGWRRGSRLPRPTRRRMRTPSSPCFPRGNMSATSISARRG